MRLNTIADRLTEAMDLISDHRSVAGDREAVEVAMNAIIALRDDIRHAIRQEKERAIERGYQGQT